MVFYPSSVCEKVFSGGPRASQLSLTTLRGPGGDRKPLKGAISRDCCNPSAQVSGQISAAYKARGSATSP